MKHMRRAMALLMVLLVPFIIACAKQAQQAEVEEQPAATATPLVTATPDSGSQAVTLTMPPAAIVRAGMLTVPLPVMLSVCPAPTVTPV